MRQIEKIFNALDPRWKYITRDSSGWFAVHTDTPRYCVDSGLFKSEGELRSMGDHVFDLPKQRIQGLEAFCWHREDYV